MSLLLTADQIQEYKNLPTHMRAQWIHEIITGYEGGTLHKMLFGTPEVFNQPLTEAETTTLLHKPQAGALNKVEKFQVMLNMQDSLNVATDGDDWKTNNRQWYRAAMMEATEALDHYGWKWWKHTEGSIDQAHLELVDIWHFAMSDWLEQQGSMPLTFDEMATIVGLFDRAETSGDFAEDCETFIGCAVTHKHITVKEFASMCKCLQLDFETLYKWYIGKNVLNRFRQAHGYKEGTYQKIWAGKEDNERLADLLDCDLDYNAEDFPMDLYEALSRLYTEMAGY